MTAKKRHEAERTAYGEEDERHQYMTPPEAVLALMAHEQIPMRVWEPACGTGNIVKVLREQGRVVLASDIERQGCPSSMQLDFLTAGESIYAQTQAIVTNPPFNLLRKGWVEKCLQAAPDVYLLLRLQFLEGQSDWRSHVLEHTGLRRTLIFRDRLPMMHREGWTGPRSTSRMAFAWFCWRRGWTGHNSIQRISWKHPKPALPPPGPKAMRNRCKATPDMFAQEEHPDA